MIAVLPEDSGADGHAVAEALAIAAARLITDEAVLPERVTQAFADDVAAGRWKGRRKHRQHAIRVVQGLASWLVAHPGAIVVFHFDGDCAWRHRREGENASAFVKKIFRPVADLLAKRGHAGHERRLVAMVPHWHIEAWTYRNLAKLRRLASRERDDALLDRLTAWEADPTLLDEEEQPKELGRARDRHNLALTKGWPASDAKGDGKSFATFVDALRAAVGP